MADKDEAEQEIPGGGQGLIAKQLKWVTIAGSYEEMMSIRPDGVQVVHRAMVSALANALGDEPVVKYNPSPSGFQRQEQWRMARRLLAKVFPEATIE